MEAKCPKCRSAWDPTGWQNDRLLCVAIHWSSFCSGSIGAALMRHFVNLQMKKNVILTTFLFVSPNAISPTMVSPKLCFFNSKGKTASFYTLKRMETKRSFPLHSSPLWWPLTYFVISPAKKIGPFLRWIPSILKKIVRGPRRIVRGPQRKGSFILLWRWTLRRSWVAQLYTQGGNDHFLPWCTIYYSRRQ